jgi:hypothetical protein
MSPEQMRKKAAAEEESLRHLRYAQADGMRESSPKMYADAGEKLTQGGSGGVDYNAHGAELQ